MDGRSDHGASSSRRGAGESVITDYGLYRSSCGYCRSGGRTSLSHGLGADRITVDDYQELLDRGWRRSGMFLYKPDMERTCCRLYTIRLKADEFVAAKEQARVSRRMQRFLDGNLCLKKADLANGQQAAPNALSTDSSNQSPNIWASETLMKESSTDTCSITHELDQYDRNLSVNIDIAVSTCIKHSVLPSTVNFPQASVKRVVPQMKKKLHNIARDLLYTCSIAFQIAAAIRRSSVEKEFTPAYVAEKLAEAMDLQGEFSDLSVRACNGHLNFYSERKQASSDKLSCTVVTSVKSPQGNAANAKRKCLLDDKSPSQVKKKKLEIRMSRSSFDPEEFALYQRYQIKVHNDKPDHLDESLYRRFLVESPLIFVPPAGDGTVPSCGFGSFHQQYLIDGKLVAVGVVDVLPRCLSSKYLFWDPDFAFLSLGKYSALQEINWVKETGILCPSIQYYYLGYYIHECGKMRYKASYSPSELLCPLRYQWVPFHIAKPLLDKKPYVVLSDFIGLEKESDLPCQTEAHSASQPSLISEEEEDEVLSDGDEQLMVEFDCSDSGADDNTSSELLNEVEHGDVNNIKIRMSNKTLLFKDLVQAFGPSKGIDSLKMQLHRYMTVVGSALSKRMIYLLD
ncbi:arginyl-tRNA--protein transferase 2 isoform X2 [Nymphaea colorata]|nr:arginyl-tRNA--protein transferase 2 isoform X2 [Nymphaea colorata]